MYIADLHIHSRYSRATSKDCTPEHLDLWAAKKGIHIVGSGDFTHPAWREELREKLEPAEDGLYVLKKEYRLADETAGADFRPRFVITGEISSIYKKNGRVRKVHSLILLPGLEAAEKISQKLEEIGNIHSDGRPILGLDCRDLLEIILNICPEAIYVPAHIWTPHFSLFGAFSGFDTVEECFEDLSGHIHAMETGLSSDPPMNWRVSALDNYQLISNSDAHSPAKLGREANLLDIELSYAGLSEAIQKGKGLYGTIEFFPEEGKYHMDGHRKCSLCLTPLETENYKGICPVCGKKITIGVSHRVEQLSDRAEGFVRENAKPFESLVPLPEVIGASVGHSSTSVKVQKEYQNMLRRLGPEFEILRTIPVEEIRTVSGRLVAEGIERLRRGEVKRIPGFDGEYGNIQLFAPRELEDTDGQMSFFDMLGIRESASGTAADSRKGTALSEEAQAPDKNMPADIGAAEDAPDAAPPESTVEPIESVQKQASDAVHFQKESAENPAKLRETQALNPAQLRAVQASARDIAVIAGPGTGKTKTLVFRIVYLIQNRKVKPSEITAVTFTNQAAGQMFERVQEELGRRKRLNGLQIGTFHAICLSFLKEQGEEFTLIDKKEAREIAREVLAEGNLNMKAGEFLETVSRRKSGIAQDIAEKAKWMEMYEAYQAALTERHLLDFDDLLVKTVQIIREGKALPGWEKRFSYLLIDEFQDMDPLQFSLMEAWREAGRELFVIGDANQSIYGFRGADSRCFERLVGETENLEVIRLEENYRSSPEILSAALEVISQNPKGETKLNANCPHNAPVRLASAKTDMGEAIFIAKEINRITGGLGMLEAQSHAEHLQDRKIRGFDEIAILYRTHRQADLLEVCLKKEGIPYVVAGRESFLEEEKVQGSIQFFKYLGDEKNLCARTCSLELLWKLEASALSEEIFEKTVQKFRPLYQKCVPKEFVRLWMEEMGLVENPAMIKLEKTALFYEDMTQFLEALDLGVESDLKRCGDKEYTAGAVQLMTLHGSKGLEFPAVFIFGAEKGKIPYESERHPADTEEERRLLYVGMTRAKEELILTTSGEESQFLEGMTEEWILRESARKEKKDEGYEQMSLFI